MAKKKVSVINVLLTLIVIVLSFIVGIQAVKIEELERNAINLIPGESIGNLKLITQDNIFLDNSVFMEGAAIIFCFETPCASCNPNLNAWQNLARFFGKEVSAFGVILDDDPLAVDTLRAKKVNFPLYLPVDREVFRRKMRLRTNMAQTIVVYKNKVKTVKLGNLTPEDLKFLINTVKRCIGRI